MVMTVNGYQAPTCYTGAIVQHHSLVGVVVGASIILPPPPGRSSLQLLQFSSLLNVNVDITERLSNVLIYNCVICDSKVGEKNAFLMYC